MSGLLALDEIEEAKEFLHVLKTTHTAVRETLDSHIQVPTLGGPGARRYRGGRPA